VSPPIATGDSLQPLREFEAMRRASADFAHRPASDTTFGADPYALVRLPLSPEPSTSSASGSPRFVGVLRGASAVVLLDEALHERSRLDAPASPSAIAVSTRGDVFVAGELSHTIQRYRLTGAELRPNGTMDLPDVRAIRGLATGPEGTLYVVEEHDGRLLTLVPGADAPVPPGGSGPSGPPILFRRTDTNIGHGPLRVERVGRTVLVDCLLDHALVLRRVDAEGVPVAYGEMRIVHDGPMWGFDAVEVPRVGGSAPDLLVAAGGVEDHPLDRTEGSFGFVDSFLYLYRVSGGAATRLAAVNTSALGIVTPKAVSLTRDARGAVEVVLAAYGSDQGARLLWAHAPDGTAPAWPTGVPGPRGPDSNAGPQITAFACPPGSASLLRLDDGSLAVANPLLDAWVHAASGGGRDVDVVGVESSPARERSLDSRMGEALFFTTLMAPWNKSDGRLSRFACETCHFEGYVDGRTHSTGRGDVRATTKPLLGLFNDRPYFSRALDPDLAAVADNEFRVAGARSGRDPRFTLRPRDFPWLANLGVGEAEWRPDDLRRALMTFFMDLGHRPNPAVLGKSRWSNDERSGAEVFRDRCESCHAARLVADDPSTRVPFDQWERFVLAPAGVIVWARADYAKTGVEPYVGDKGARVTSLRRLFKKYPYFTNGTAESLSILLDRVRYDAASFFHERAPESAALRALTPREKETLLAFLDLL
jgi:hypothetical protein